MQVIFIFVIASIGIDRPVRCGDQEDAVGLEEALDLRGEPLLGRRVEMLDGLERDDDVETMKAWDRDSVGSTLEEVKVVVDIHPSGMLDRLKGDIHPVDRIGVRSEEALP